MSKFADFEGIDLDSKVVYETSDLEDEIVLDEGYTERRSSITEDEADIANSRKRFEKEFIDSHVTDFSDRIDRLESYETYTVKETTKNKLERIRNELAELDAELDLEDRESEELERLKEVFSRINRKSKDRKLLSLNITPETINTEIHVEKLYASDPQKFQQLEEKIAKLEKVIGYEFTPTSSVQAIVNDLFRKFKLLSNDQEELQNIDRIVEEVNAKLEKSIAFRRNLAINNEVKEDDKIHEIYTKYQRVSDLVEELPYILARLESLNDLHRDVSGSVNMVEDLDNQISSLKEDFTKWDVSLTKLETKLNDLNIKFENTRTQTSQE